MTRGEAWTLHLSTALVGGTGLVYGWMRYLVEPEPDEFGEVFAVVNHPLQPDLQHLHVLLAPLLVFGAGMIFRRHVWARVRSGFEPRRRSGLVLFALLLPMIASGYLLQTSTDELWRTVWIWGHGLASAVWIAGYLLHLGSPREAPPAADPVSG